MLGKSGGSTLLQARSWSSWYRSHSSSYFRAPSTFEQECKVRKCFYKGSFAQVALSGSGTSCLACDATQSLTLGCINASSDSCLVLSLKFYVALALALAVALALALALSLSLSLALALSLSLSLPLSSSSSSSSSPSSFSSSPENSATKWRHIRLVNSEVWPFILKSSKIYPPFQSSPSMDFPARRMSSRMWSKLSMSCSTKMGVRGGVLQ